MAHVDPDGFILFSGAGPKIDSAGAGGGSVVVREVVDGVDDRGGF